MEVNASPLEKKEANEVVLRISGVECQIRGSSPKPNTEPIELENPLSSSQISNSTSPSAMELTQSIPTPSELLNIQTRKSISSSTNEKLKSRSMEPPHPSDTSASASKGAVELALSKFPVSSVPSPAVEDEDDEDVCETVNPESQVMSGRMKFILAQLVMFVCITVLLIASLTIRNLRNIVIWHLATDWSIALLVFLIDKKYLPEKKVFYFLFASKNSAAVFAWLCLVILAWVLLINHGVKCSRHTTKILNRVTRALLSCLIGAALWLIKSVLITSLAVSFQHKRIFDRMQDYFFQHYVIRQLSGPVVPSLKVDIEKLIKMKLDKVFPRKIINLADSLRDKEMTNGQEAKDAAKKIFKNVAKSGSQFIEKDDLLRFMPKERVEKFLAFFPGAKETGKIRKSLFKIWLKTCIDKLDKLASALFLVVIIILGLLLTGLLTTPVQIFISSQLLLLEFIFGNAAKDLFEAIVFVFVKHPFDVSDRCLVDGDELEVEEMNIMTTVFLTKDDEKKSYPNSVLASKPIINSGRSAKMSESLEFVVDLSTSVESLEALTNKIREYIERKPRHWHRDHSVEFKEIAEVDNSKVLKMALHVTHTLDCQEVMERTKRRSELVLELKKIFEELHLK
ncbi:hypothetical protein EUGRSUZ_C03566 [Eucalyptus grandis]|uniref:Uncharacterized protein n=2 Tax=Eucalyptus grandis TaxID=71139 RepID=A0ACC3LKC8_EUCGR|nr:hypothetical protein EUGRSUZ_C03566 [Eucalyptus grandis]